MKSIIIISATVILLSVLLVYCTKSNPGSGCKWDPGPPPSLILKITKAGIILNDSMLLGCKLSYFEGTVKKYVSDFTKNNLEAAYQGMGLITTRLTGTLSADYNIKTFYLEYPNGWDTDTLHIDYLPYSPATNCLNVQNPIKQNGQLTGIDNSFHFVTPVYIISKP